MILTPDIDYGSII